MALSVQLSCWSSGFEILSIEHNQIAQLLYRCKFGFLIIVLPHRFTGFLESLATELMDTCHPLNVVLRGRIPQGFCNWPVCSRVVAIICKEWCHLDCGMERVVVGILCHCQHFFPIILFIIAVVSEITLYRLVHSIRLSFSLWMKG